MFPRTLQLNELIEKKSHFLFGPRGVGKSFLIRHELSDIAIIINLLRPEYFLRLSSHPGQLEQIIDAELTSERRFVVIDEVQKLPVLLDEVHRLIEERRFVFLLTGSSARKLRHGGANLLGGRARLASLLPLTAYELGASFDLDRYLHFGGLPSVVLSREPEEDLQAYVATYLQEEIKAEGLIRKLPAFSAFLRTAATSNSQVINFAKFASDVEVSAPTIREYFSILEDTLMGQMIEPWRKSQKRRAMSSGKFYFFDTGVTRTLAGTRTIDRNSDLYGKAFEHWIFMELRAWLAYRRQNEPLTFWRVDASCEVDFLIGETIAIEAKATTKVRDEDFRSLRALQEENVFTEYVVVSHDPIKRVKDRILCLPWKEFVPWLWAR